MEFNAKKCPLIEMRTGGERPRWTCKLGEEEVSKAKGERDLGVTIQEELSPEKHINRIVGATSRLLT